MEEIKIIEAIVIMMFIFPGLALMVMMFLAIFIHISFNRTGLTSLFYEDATREDVFFPKNAVSNGGLISSSWDRTRFMIRWCLKEEYAKEDTNESDKAKIFYFKYDTAVMFSIILIMDFLMFSYNRSNFFSCLERYISIVKSIVTVKTYMNYKNKNFHSLPTERVTVVCEEPYQIRTSLYRFDNRFC